MIRGDWSLVSSQYSVVSEGIMSNNYDERITYITIMFFTLALLQLKCHLMHLLNQGIERIFFGGLTERRRQYCLIATQTRLG